MLFLGSIAQPDFGKFLRSLGLGKKHINRGFLSVWFFSKSCSRSISSIQFSEYHRQESIRSKNKETGFLVMCFRETQCLFILASFKLSHPSEQSRSQLTHQESLYQLTACTESCCCSLATTACSLHPPGEREGASPPHRSHGGREHRSPWQFYAQGRPGLSTLCPPKPPHNSVTGIKNRYETVNLSKKANRSLPPDTSKLR